MICAEMIRATYRLDELCPISANTKRPLLAESGTSNLVDFGVSDVRYAPGSGHWANIDQKGR